jgi:hypothetical protein
MNYARLDMKIELVRAFAETASTGIRLECWGFPQRREQPPSAAPFHASYFDRRLAGRCDRRLAGRCDRRLA